MRTEETDTDEKRGSIHLINTSHNLLLAVPVVVVCLAAVIWIYRDGTMQLRTRTKGPFKGKTCSLFTYCVHGVINLFLHVGIFSLFVCVFFFSVVHLVEKMTVQNNIKRVIQDLIQQLEISLNMNINPLLVDVIPSLRKAAYTPQMCQEDREITQYNNQLKSFALHFFTSAFLILIGISALLWCLSYTFNLVKIIHKGKVDNSANLPLWDQVKRDVHAYNRPRRLQKIMNDATGRPAKVDVASLLPLSILALTSGGYCIFQGMQGTPRMNLQRVVEFTAAFATVPDEEKWVAKAQAYLDGLTEKTMPTGCGAQVIGFVPFNSPNWEITSSLDLCPCLTWTVRDICRKQKQHAQAVRFKVQVGIHNHKQFVQAQQLARHVNTAAFWVEQHQPPALPPNLMQFRKPFRAYMKGKRGKCGGSACTSFTEYLGPNASRSLQNNPRATERLQAWWEEDTVYTNNSLFQPWKYISINVTPAIAFCYPMNMMPENATLWWENRKDWNASRSLTDQCVSRRSEIHVREDKIIYAGIALLVLGVALMLWVVYGIQEIHIGDLKIQHRKLYFVPPNTKYLKQDATNMDTAEQAVKDKIALEKHIMNREWWHTPFEQCLFWWHKQRPLAQLSKTSMQKACDYVDLGRIIHHNAVILFFVVFTEMFFLYGVTLNYDSLNVDTVRGMILTKIVEFAKSGSSKEEFQNLFDRLLDPGQI